MFGLPPQLWIGLIGLLIFRICSMNFSECSACSEDKSKKNVCRTPACERAASSLIESMDENFDPCSNFYDFACGGFLKKSVILKDMLGVTEFVRIQLKVQEELLSSIENGTTDNDPQAFKLLKSFYDVCMNEDWIEKNSVAEFKEILDKLGGWPLLAGGLWNETAFDWRSTILKFREAGFRFSQFINVHVTKDLKNKSISAVYLDHAETDVSYFDLEQGLENDVVKAYFKYMVDLAVLLGFDRNGAVEELGQTLNFEINLAKISVTLSQERDNFKLYHPMSVADLQKGFPLPGSGPNWLEYLNGLLQPQASLQDDDIVIVESPIYLKALFKLLDETPKRVQANYAFWCVARWAAVRLNERINDAVREFLAVMDGQLDSGPRWQHCLMQVNHYLPLAVGTFYVRKHVPEGTKEIATELITDIIQSFKRLLQEVDWMSDTTKKSALGKLESMKSIIAYPAELLDDEKINDYYNGLQIHPESYLQTSLSLNLFELKHEINKLNKPMIDRFDWLHYSHAATFDAFYSLEDNTIIFSAAILQGTFFDKDNPKYMNYASLGSSAGYKMSQSFYGQARMFDKNGNMCDWWDDRSKVEYLRIHKCFRDQYQNYTIKKFNLNLTSEAFQGENLADNCGVKEAYYAYEDWEKRHAPEPRLPGLKKYSPKQLFWISYASMSCNIRKEAPSILIKTGQQVPLEYRVNGPLSNIPEFARDFNCPKDSPMNLENRCKIW